MRSQDLCWGWWSSSTSWSGTRSIWTSKPDTQSSTNGGWRFTIMASDAVLDASQCEERCSVWIHGWAAVGPTRMVEQGIARGWTAKLRDLGRITKSLWRAGMGNGACGPWGWLHQSQRCWQPTWRTLSLRSYYFMVVTINNVHDSLFQPLPVMFFLQLFGQSCFFSSYLGISISIRIVLQPWQRVHMSVTRQA